MKTISILKVAIVTVTLALFASCKSTKNVVTTAPVAPRSMELQETLNKVLGNQQTAKFITSKIKFQVKVGNQDMTLTGNLKMKRDDVIRLQLMAFGFVEAARLEVTKDYVLIMDRINKQYLKASYEQLDFLRQSGLNFYSLQALFWNELFQPGQSALTPELMNKFETTEEGGDVIIALEQDKLSYRWLAENVGGLIHMSNIAYNDKYRGKSQLYWNYADFKELGAKQFPNKNEVTFTTPKTEVKINMTLNYIGNDDDWETRTAVSAKYKEVTVDDILRRFMAL